MHNSRWSKITLTLIAICLIGALTVIAGPPRLSSDSYRLELVASEPDIVTPIGMAFDGQGRLLVIESHTHQRPKNYDGPAGDRIRMFSASKEVGHLDQWSTFAEGFQNAMNLLVRPDGAVYVVTRSDIQLLWPTAEKSAADQARSKTILKLETADTYPHDGLEGVALAPDGALLVSMGENHGTAFRLVGSDGSAISGQGEGGNLFRCTPDGGNVQRWARGFWNPFSLCVTPAGRIFTADNDPDACSPCRLVEMVPGGDYGFRFCYGRSGLHPLQAWNGELPGTLPYICGVGEAPTALILHQGRLWATSWGDHQINAYTLTPRRASFAATCETVVQGDDDFRPTGMAVAPDGSIYFGDWIRRDYPVHGHGKIWHLTTTGSHQHEADASTAFEKLPPVVIPPDEAPSALASDFTFIRAAAVWTLSQKDDLETRIAQNPSYSKVRLGLLEALRIRGGANIQSILSKALTDQSADVRLFAVRWIADDRITALRNEVAKLLDGPQSDSRYFLAVLAAVDWLGGDGHPTNAGITDTLFVQELENDNRSPALRARLLGLLSPDNRFLTSDRIATYLQSDNQPLRLEAVRALAQQSRLDRFTQLADVARDDKQSEEIRAAAIMGLAGAAEEYRQLLSQFAADDAHSSLQHEAQRVMRLTRLAPAPNETKPAADDIAAWSKLLESPGDAAAGRRLFFSSIGARCSVCHQYSGRGGRIGPDLSQIARTNSREKIITSILQPSREIAPEFQPWVLVTTDGRSLVGLRLPKPGDDGMEDYADPAGKKFTLPSSKIEVRTASAKSIMPDGLEQLISIADLRDLLAFLASSPDAAPRADPTSQAVPVLFPVTDAKDVCPDTPLTITFATAPVIGSGTIEVLDASNDTFVETIDLTIATRTKTIGGIPNFNYRPVLITDNQAEIYLPNHALDYNKMYVVKISDGAFKGADGNALAVLGVTNPWRFSTKASPPASGASRLIVAADGSGDFATVQGAIDFIPEGNRDPVTIFIRKGTYHEIVCYADKHNLTFLGEDRKQTIIAYANNERFNNNAGGNPFAQGQRANPSAATVRGGAIYRRGLFLAHHVSDLKIVNLTLRNTTPQGGSQAEAIILNGPPDSHAILTDVDLYSFQDTLQINGQAYISNCYLEGDVDFMWGKGPCFFENCETKTLRDNAYYTQIRNPDTNHGYIYHNCIFDGAPGVTGNLLSRIAPARFPASEVVLLNCTLTDAVGAVGWRLDQATEAPDVHFWEYNSHDPAGNPVDTSTRLSISKQLTKPADDQTIENYSDPRWVLGGQWTPELPPIITTQPTSATAGQRQKLMLRVSTAAIPSPSYQWRRNDVEIADATAATYSIDSVSPADAGQYTVVISNSAGSATSAPVTVTLKEND
jgi:putative membrane-bound dehydrogenase-like protein